MRSFLDVWTKYVCHPYVTPAVDSNRVSQLYHSSLWIVDSTIPYSDDVLLWFFFIRPCFMPFIVNHGSVGVVRYDPKRVARQFGYDQGVPLVHISFCSFKECLVGYFITSSDDFI